VPLALVEELGGRDPSIDPIVNLSSERMILVVRENAAKIIDIGQSATANLLSRNSFLFSSDFDMGHGQLSWVLLLPHVSTQPCL
jgi:hypothetical protein